MVLPVPSVRNGNRMFCWSRSALSRTPRDFEITPKEISDEGGMLVDHMERPVLDPIAERNDAPHPDALPLLGGDLAHPLASDLALKLGEG